MTAYIVSSGVLSSGLVLGHLDTLSVLGGGAAISIADRGLEQVASGGAASATTVFGGGILQLSAGASANGVTISAGGIVSGAGLLRGTVTDAGVIDGNAIGTSSDASGADAVFVLSGGRASGATIEAGGSINVFGGGATTVRLGSCGGAGGSG